ncbi:hypothetical protein QQZ08_004967 [Neonectria magnoliae]|uniref:Integral membrane protein n=1 Tax=Neonectria magnoliae TaxID=2732573 RepID=A0ABR1I4Q9_9HYPO
MARYVEHRPLRLVNRLLIRFPQMALPNKPPDSYRTPRFPSLNVQTLYDTTDNKQFTLYDILDVWRFTLMWTLILYSIFHMGAVLIAMFTHGWKKSSWKYLWAVPVVYLIMAGLEAVMAGSITGLVSVHPVLRLWRRSNVVSGWEPCTRPDTTR